MSSLKPCPWCGAIPDTNDGESGGTVECCNRQCPVQPSIFRDHEPSYDGLSLATDGWNTRSSDATADKLVGLLREARPDVSTWDSRREECSDPSCSFRDLVGDVHGPGCILSRIDAALAAYDAEKEKP